MTSGLLLSAFFAMAKLDPAYLVAYGSGASDTEVVEYYSLSCPKCLELFVTDFPKLREIRPDVRFVFHPDPADLLTLQAMVCFELLKEEQKPIFLETVLECLHENQGRGGLAILQTAMDALGLPVSDLGKIEFLETTNAYRAAFRFLIQEDVVTFVPSYEINGTFFDAPPISTSIEEQLRNL